MTKKATRPRPKKTNKPPKIPDSRVSNGTRKILSNAGYHVKFVSREKHRRLKYRSRKQRKRQYTVPIKINLDYASLQFVGIVRYYIQKKYQLHINEIELLLFLYPLGIWSRKDYDSFPHRYTTRTTRNFKSRGLIEEVFDQSDWRRKKQLFKLSKQAKKIVSTFYEYLHLEKPLPEISAKNPLFGDSISPRLQVIAKSMAVLNQMSRGEEKITPAHDKLNQRITKRGKTNEPQKKRRFEGIHKQVEEKRRLEKKTKEIEQKYREQGLLR